MRTGRPPAETWPKSGVYVGITQLGRAPGKAWQKLGQRQVVLSLTHAPSGVGLSPDCSGSVYEVGQGDPNPASLTDSPCSLLFTSTHLSCTKM